VNASVGAYVAQVDGLLGAGQALFPASTGPVGIDGGEPAVPTPPAHSATTAGVADAGQHYRRNWRGLTGLDTQTDDTAGQGRVEGDRGRARATGIRHSARGQAAAIAPLTGSPAGVRRLVSSMDEQLAAMQHQLDTTKAQNRLLATRLHQLAAAYRTAAGTPMSGWSMRGITGRGAADLGGLGAMPPSTGLSRIGLPSLSGVRSPRAPSMGEARAAGMLSGGAPALTRSSTPREVAARIIWEAHRRGYSRDQAIAILSAAMQESGLNPRAVSPNGAWESVFQQDASYPGRRDPNTAVSEFFNRLDAKGGPSSPDIWKSIFWLQQRPGEPSAEAAVAHGRQGYLVEIQSRLMPATRLYNQLTAAPDV
jgi:hypothetical protein